jgi:WD40 repeat protein
LGAAAAVEEAMKPRLAGVKPKLVLLVLAIGLPVAGAGTPAVFGDEPRLQMVLQLGHTERVTSVALSADGKHLVTGSFDKTAILWEAFSGKKLQTAQGHTDWVKSVAFSADGRQVITGSLDGTAILWEVRTGQPRLVFRGHSTGVTSVALSANGRHLWTGSKDGSTRLWDAGSGRELCRLLSLDDGKDWLVVTPDGFYDGTKGAWRYVAYRTVGTLQLVEDAATLQSFYRPGLLGLLLKGQPISK